MCDYSATSEPLCRCDPPCAYYVRLHPAPDARHGDPWVFACAVTREGEAAVVRGGAGKPSKGAYHALLAELRRLGFRRRRWSHVKNGVEVWHERKL